MVPLWCNQLENAEHQIWECAKEEGSVGAFCIAGLVQHLILNLPQACVVLAVRQICRCKFLME